MFWYKFDDRSLTGRNSRPWSLDSETGNSDDQDLYGAVLSYTWNDLNVLRCFVLYWIDNTSSSSRLNHGQKQSAHKNIPTLAVSADIYAIDKPLEIYGELGYEFGVNDASAHREINAFGGYVGMEYTFGKNMRPYVGAEFHYLEGDHGFHVQWQDFDGSYATTLIFEGDNQDAKQFEEGGYMRATALGGLKTLPHKMRFDFLASWLQSTDEADRKQAGDNIGWEFDAIWSWAYSTDLKFEIGFGWLLVDDDYAANGGARGANGYHPGAKSDDVWLVVWNTTVRF